jgi:predicted homoserine dehydrogenase-like protein
MIIVDNALRARQEQGRPVSVGMIGAGFMAQGVANQIVNSVPGMEMTAIYGRKPERAFGAYRYAGVEEPVLATTQGQLEDAVRAGRAVVTEDALLLARSEQLDALIDVTGSVEFGAQVVMEAFRHGKHVVLMNAELDATIGPILQVNAAEHGVTVSATDGDEPGLQMNLYRWVKGIGLTPRVMGNVKGLQDRYRNPETQRGFAEKWGQNPTMVTSFADGSKISFEQTILANATGAKVVQRGMSRGVPFDAARAFHPYSVTLAPRGARTHHQTDGQDH